MWWTAGPLAATPWWAPTLLTPCGASSTGPQTTQAPTGTPLVGRTPGPRPVSTRSMGGAPAHSPVRQPPVCRSRASTVGMGKARGQVLSQKPSLCRAVPHLGPERARARDALRGPEGRQLVLGEDPASLPAQPLRCFPRLPLLLTPTIIPSAAPSFPSPQKLENQLRPLSGPSGHP